MKTINIDQAISEQTVEAISAFSGDIKETMLNWKLDQIYDKLSFIQQALSSESNKIEISDLISSIDEIDYNEIISANLSTLDSLYPDDVDFIEYDEISSFIENYEAENGEIVLSDDTPPMGAARDNSIYNSMYRGFIDGQTDMNSVDILINTINSKAALINSIQTKPLPSIEEIGSAEHCEPTNEYCVAIDRLAAFYDTILDKISNSDNILEQVGYWLGLGNDSGEIDEIVNYLKFFKANNDKIDYEVLKKNGEDVVANIDVPLFNWKEDEDTGKREIDFEYRICNMVAFYDKWAKITMNEVPKDFLDNLTLNNWRHATKSFHELYKFMRAKSDACRTMCETVPSLESLFNAHVNSYKKAITDAYCAFKENEITLETLNKTLNELKYSAQNLKRVLESALNAGYRQAAGTFSSLKGAINSIRQSNITTIRALMLSGAGAGLVAKAALLLFLKIAIIILLVVLTIKVIMWIYNGIFGSSRDSTNRKAIKLLNVAAKSMVNGLNTINSKMTSVYAIAKDNIVKDLQHHTEYIEVDLNDIPLMLNVNDLNECIYHENGLSFIGDTEEVLNHFLDKDFEEAIGDTPYEEKFLVAKVDNGIYDNMFTVSNASEMLNIIRNSDFIYVRDNPIKIDGGYMPIPSVDVDIPPYPGHPDSCTINYFMDPTDETPIATQTIEYGSSAFDSPDYGEVCTAVMGVLGEVGITIDQIAWSHKENPEESAMDDLSHVTEDLNVALDI